MQTTPASTPRALGAPLIALAPKDTTLGTLGSLYPENPPFGIPSIKIAHGGTLVSLYYRHQRADQGRPRAHDRRARRADEGRPDGYTPRADTRFTYRSRMALLRRLNAIDRHRLRQLPLMLTCTYGRDWPSRPYRWKRDLECLIRRIRARYPHAAGVWRIEPQERGTPHAHILLWNVPFLPHDDLARMWAQITKGGPDVERAGTSVERVRSWSSALAYMAKPADDARFFTPDGERVAFSGRHWAFFGEKYLPVSWQERPLDQAVFLALRNRLAEHLRSLGYTNWTPKYGRPRGITVFLPVEEALDWLDAIEGALRAPRLPESRGKIAA